MTQPYCELHDTAHHEFLHREVERLQKAVQLKGEAVREAQDAVGRLREEVGDLRGIIADLEDELDERVSIIERLRVDKSHFAKRAERAENLQRQAEAEAERLRKNEAMLVETAKNRKAEVTRLWQGLEKSGPVERRDFNP
jgi:chromosome segregation ATPase